MDNIEKKLPKSALSLYVKLYCKKRNRTKTKCNYVLKEATKSWLSLSKSEKQLFLSKYHDYKNNLAKAFAEHLKRAEPYLKKKITKKTHLDIEVLDATNNAEEIGFNVEPHEFTLDNDDNISNGNPLTSDNVERESLQSLGQKTHYSNNVHENEDLLLEPSPPQLINGRQLFDMIHVNKTITWDMVPKKEKRHYQNAVLKIKKNYLNDYKKYLEQMSSEKLYYYHKNIVSAFVSQNA